jgi:DNA-binding MarR family transcriptional regulator
MRQRNTNQVPDAGNAISDIASDCLMGRARLITRVITSLYDEKLRPFAIKATQLNLLVVIAQAGPIRRIDIGDLIQLDPSTLTRNLQVMLTNGWVEDVQGAGDARGLPLNVTAKGKELLQRVAPAWQLAQQEARKLLGDDGAALLMRLSSSLIGPVGR